jgi:hypothetical protein
MDFFVNNTKINFLYINFDIYCNLVIFNTFIIKDVEYCVSMGKVCLKIIDLSLSDYKFSAFY